MESDDDSKSAPAPPGSSGASSGIQRFWLRFGDHDVELKPGETLIGRSPKCQLVVDDPLVSRRHARILLFRGTATVEDLESINGVFVNGERLSSLRTLVSGDRIVVGQQSFQLYVAAPASGQAPERSTAQTLSGMVRPQVPRMFDDRSEATRQGDAFDMLIGVVEKVLSLGRGDEAERILANYLRNLLQTARINNEIDTETAEKAARYAIRIAEATGKGAWADYVFDLYTILRRPLPGPLVERLYDTLRNLSPINLGLFRRYLSVLRAIDPQLGPADRFLVRRIQGLEELLVSR